MTRSSPVEAPATTAGALRALRVVATVSVLFIVLQGVTAGEILSRSRTAESLHYAGAYAVHLFTALTAVAAYLVLRQRQGPRWPTVAAVVIFVIGFVQAAVGEAGILAVHVPLAMLLLVGAVLVMGWSFARSPR
jgi:ammonia channel protein AmtB